MDFHHLSAIQEPASCVMQFPATNDVTFGKCDVKTPESGKLGRNRTDVSGTAQNVDAVETKQR